MGKCPRAIQDAVWNNALPLIFLDANQPRLSPHAGGSGLSILLMLFLQLSDLRLLFHLAASHFVFLHRFLNRGFHCLLGGHDRTQMGRIVQLSWTTNTLCAVGCTEVALLNTT